MSGTDDMADAYRHVPCATPQYTVFSLWSSELGRAVFFTLPGFNFGLASAVPQFNRLPELFTAVARTLLHVVCCHYFDDFNVTEPVWAATSGQRVLGELLRVIGFPFSAAKHISVGPEVVFLGVVSSFEKFEELGLVAMSVKPARIEKLVQGFDEVLERGTLSCAQAARMAGKLGFTMCWAFGRFGRAPMQPLHARASDTDGSWGDPLSPALRASLNFFRSLLPCLEPYVFEAEPSQEPPTLVWTDGRYDMDQDEYPWSTPIRCPYVEGQPKAGVGYVVATPKRGAPAAVGPCPQRMSVAEAKERLATQYDFVHGSADVPESFMEGFSPRKQYIGQVELLGALVPYISVPHLLGGRRVIHWIDNTSAIAAMVKGYSARPDSARLVHAWHALNTDLRARVWFEYVPTDANIADAPSRLPLWNGFYHFGFHDKQGSGLGSVAENLIIPAEQQWDDQAATWASGEPAWGPGC